MLAGLSVNKRSAGSTALLCGLLLPSVWGCGKAKEPWETVYPVKGTVAYKGKPVANADIALFPVDSSIPSTVRPRARSSGDGAFTVWTYEVGDGAPAGTYKATVVRNEVVVSNGAVGSKPSNLPRKYARPETTNLIIEIGQGETQIPKLELK